jgi:hypothetical protein
MGLTDNSMKTYLNRRVPVVYQGRTFATRNLLEAALTVVPMVAVSALATVAGVSIVLVTAPFVLYGIAVALIRFGRTLGDEPEEAGRGVFKTYWEESDTEAITAMEEDDEDVAPQPAST